MRKATFGILVVACFGCGSDAIKGSGTVVTTAHDLTSEFAALEISPGLMVRVASGESPTISVKGDHNIVEHFDIRQDHTTLFLTLNPEESYAPTRPVEVTLDARRLNQITITGSRIVLGPIASQSLSVVASDWAEVEIQDLPADSFSAVLSGGSTMTVNGSVDDETYILSDGSELHGFDLKSSRSSVNLSGGSFAEIQADDIIDVVATDDSELIIDGEAMVESNLSDRAEIVHR